ncbi:cytochrome P450, partial [Bombardia bombarda]
RRRFAATGNTYQGSVLGMPFLATIEPANLRAIFTRIDDFSKSGRRIDWWPMLQGGILVADGHEWKTARGLLQPAFSRSKLARLDELEHHAQELIGKIPRDGGTVELQSLFLQFTFDAGLGLIVGQKHDQVSEFEKGEQTKLGKNMALALFEAGRRSKVGMLRLLDPVDKEKKVEEQKGGGEDGDEKEYIFFEELVHVTTDRIQLRWELSTAMAGARDTTGGLLAHIFWELARRPDVWAKLQADVDGLGLGEDKKPSYDDLKLGLVYLKAILNESLRMYPNIGITFRWAARDTTLPTGGGPDGKSPCFVPRGRRIITSFNALHHRKDLWGDDADEFRPERWLEELSQTQREEGTGRQKRFKLKSVPNWTYLPFGAGPRICPGQHFAMVEAQYLIVRIMQTFRRIECRDDRPYAEEAGIPITVKHGTLV